MGELEGPFDPKATMQVDAAEVAEVVESQSASRPASARKTPPPLPSSGPFAAARGAEVAPSPAAGRAQRLRFALIVAAMLALAAIGGWVFANLVRGPTPAASTVTSGPAAPQPTGSASAPLTLPPVEIR